MRAHNSSPPADRQASQAADRPSSQPATAARQATQSPSHVAN